MQTIPDSSPVMTPAPKLLGYWDLMSISLGQIIGTGVVVLTGISIGITGFGTPWAFVLALLIVAAPSICMAALGSAIPSTGGSYTYVRDLLGHKTSFVYLALLVAGQLIIASYAIGFAEYGDALLPGMNLKAVAAGVMLVCFIANFYGVKTAARFQSLMVLVLIVSLLAYVFVGFRYVGDFSVYTDIDYVMPAGFGGLLGAAFLVRLGLIGADYVAELGDETQNPGRLIPLVMASSLLIVTLLYVGIGIVATGVLPLQEVAGKNLAAVAKTIFSPAVYTLFVAGGVMLALVTSLNAIFAWSTRSLYMATEDGWLPEKLAATNRYGTPYIFLSVFFVVGILPIVTGWSLALVTILGNAVGMIFGLFPVVAVFRLAQVKPEAYAKASFRLPKSLMKVLPVLSVVIYGYGVYLSREFIGWQGFLALGTYGLLALGYAHYRSPVVEAQWQKSEL